MERLMQGIAVLFFLSAGLQYNDPDPLVWVLVYCAAGSAALVPSGSRWSRAARGLVASGAFVWALSLLPEARGIGLAEMTESMQAYDGRVEIAREAGGLLLVVAGMAVGLVADFRARSDRS
jgi:H+/Cl- antiporter ClcA